MDAVGGIFGGIGLLACCFWMSYLIALRLTTPASTSVRWCGGAIVAYWLLTAVFTILASLSAFRLSVAVAVWAGGTAVAHLTLAKSGAAVETLRRDLARVGELWRAWQRTYVRWLVLAAIGLVGARLLRGLVAPPLGWDALTYHLLKAGRWVQTGGLVSEAAPDVWNCYEYYPYTGEIFWAWAMLPAHGDAFLAPAGLLVWLSGSAIHSSALACRTRLCTSRPRAMDLC